MELPDLTDLTVNEQEDELENLSKTELKELREAEERQTAIDNIDNELSSREKTTTEDHDAVMGEEPVPDGKDEPAKSELERKVDYLIEKCKTTSMEGFENYEN